MTSYKKNYWLFCWGLSKGSSIVLANFPCNWITFPYHPVSGMKRANGPMALPSPRPHPSPLPPPLPHRPPKGAKIHLVLQILMWDLDCWGSRDKHDLWSYTAVCSSYYSKYTSIKHPCRSLARWVRTLTFSHGPVLCMNTTNYFFCCMSCIAYLNSIYIAYAVFCTIEMMLQDWLRKIFYIYIYC